MKFFAEIKPKEGAFRVPAVSVVDAGKPSEALNQVISSWFADQDISPEGATLTPLGGTEYLLGIAGREPFPVIAEAKPCTAWEVCGIAEPFSGKPLPPGEEVWAPSPLVAAELFVKARLPLYRALDDRNYDVIHGNNRMLEEWTKDSRKHWWCKVSLASVIMQGETRGVLLGQPLDIFVTEP
jgi:hypothetical protein